VDASRRPEHADPEFEPEPGPAARLRDFDPTEHHRLVINPFLAVLVLVVMAWVGHVLVSSRLRTSAVLLGLVLLTIPVGLLPYLIQYHCLDCGETGAYPRHRDHACSGVLRRWREKRRRRVPFPRPWAQVVIWGWLLGAVAVLHYLAEPNEMEGRRVD
jgi:hypothetical protein